MRAFSITVCFYVALWFTASSAYRRSDIFQNRQNELDRNKTELCMMTDWAKWCWHGWCSV